MLCGRESRGTRDLTAPPGRTERSASCGQASTSSSALAPPAPSEASTVCRVSQLLPRGLQAPLGLAGVPRRSASLLPFQTQC